MLKFRVGDKVRVVKKASRGDLPKGYTGVVTLINDIGGVLVDNKSNGWFYEGDGELEMVYPNPPHKHAEVIKAWADGAEVQIFCRLKKVWLDCGTSTPNWNSVTKARVKPQDPRKEEIKSIREEIEQLSARLKVLEGLG